MEELYSHDTYKGFHVYITVDNNYYYGDGYQNGTCLISGIKSNSGERCLEKVKSEIDAIFHYEISNQEA